MKESILNEAERLTRGERQKAYGHPIHDFIRIGKMWAAILDLPKVTPEQVALCMIAVKISREVHAPKRDNRVDMAGYANCLDMVHQYPQPTPYPQPEPDNFGIHIGGEARYLGGKLPTRNDRQTPPDAADNTY